MADYQFQSPLTAELIEQLLLQVNERKNDPRFIAELNVKLAGIHAGAQVNSAGSIPGGSSSVPLFHGKDSETGALMFKRLIAGANTTVELNDNGNIVISSSGGGGEGGPVIDENTTINVPSEHSSLSEALHYVSTATITSKGHVTILIATDFELDEHITLHGGDYSAVTITSAGNTVNVNQSSGASLEFIRCLAPSIANITINSTSISGRVLEITAQRSAMQFSSLLIGSPLSPEDAPAVSVDASESAISMNDSRVSVTTENDNVTITADNSRLYWNPSSSGDTMYMSCKLNLSASLIVNMSPRNMVMFSASNLHFDGNNLLEGFAMAAFSGGSLTSSGPSFSDTDNSSTIVFNRVNPVSFNGVQYSGKMLFNECSVIGDLRLSSSTQTHPVEIKGSNINFTSFSIDSYGEPGAVFDVVDSQLKGSFSGLQMDAGYKWFDITASLLMVSSVDSSAFEADQLENYVSGIQAVNAVSHGSLLVVNMTGGGGGGDAHWNPSADEGFMPGAPLAVQSSGIFKFDGAPPMGGDPQLTSDFMGTSNGMTVMSVKRSEPDLGGTGATPEFWLAAVDGELPDFKFLGFLNSTDNPMYNGQPHLFLTHKSIRVNTADDPTFLGQVAVDGDDVYYAKAGATMGEFDWEPLNQAGPTVSDERLKVNKGNITDTLLDAWADTRTCIFQMISDVEKHGEDAKLKVGYMAQEIERTLEAKGIDVSELSFIVKKPIYEERDTGLTEDVEQNVYDHEDVPYKEVSVIDGIAVQVTKHRRVKRPCYETLPVVDETGMPVIENGQPLMHKVAKTTLVKIPITERVVVDYQYQVDYRECFVIESAYLRREIERLKAAVGI